MRKILAITKALADQNRIRILLALRGGELCVCQITELLLLAPSTVSKHISVLKQAWLLEGRKEGRWVYYRLPGENAPSEAQKAINWVCESLEDFPEIVKDEERLKQILKIDPELLCANQLKRKK